MPLNLHNRWDLYLLGIFAFLLAAGVVWVRTATVKNTYEYVQFEKELKLAQQGIQETRVEWLKRTSPQQLDRIASRLDLRPPRVNQLMHYRQSEGQQSDAKP